MNDFPASPLLHFVFYSHFYTKNNRSDAQIIKMPPRSKKARQQAKNQEPVLPDKLPTPPLRAHSSGSDDDLLFNGSSSDSSSVNISHDDVMDLDNASESEFNVTGDQEEDNFNHDKGATAFSEMEQSPVDGVNNSCDDLANVMEVEQEAIAVDER